MNERLLYKNTRKLPEIFEESDINRILQEILKSKDYWNNDLGEWMRWRDLALIATIYLLATRPLESCRLKFEDFDFKRGIVKIHGSKRHKDRMVPVPQKLFQIYKEYFKFPKNRFWRGSPYLFPSFQGSYVSPSRLKTTFREKALKPAGLWHLNRSSKAEFRTLYKLRHSRASHILAKQIRETGRPDIFSIANLLGHADIRSTTVYLHTDHSYMDYLRKQID